MKKGAHRFLRWFESLHEEHFFVSWIAVGLVIVLFWLALERFLIPEKWKQPMSYSFLAAYVAYTVWASKYNTTDD